MDYETLELLLKVDCASLVFTVVFLTRLQLFPLRFRLTGRQKVKDFLDSRGIDPPRVGFWVSLIYSFVMRHLIASTFYTSCTLVSR